MTQFSLILAAAAALITVVLLALVARGYDRPERRVRRGLRIVLGARGRGTILAAGHGRAIGLDPASNRLATVWDAGAWGLVYDLNELRYAEVRVDDQLLGSAWRGRSQKLFDFADAPRKSVTLRLVFDDPANPDFSLDLWVARDSSGRGGRSARGAVADAAHWLGRMEALLNRPGRSWWEPQPTPEAEQAMTRPTPRFDPLSLGEAAAEAVRSASPPPAASDSQENTNRRKAKRRS